MADPNNILNQNLTLGGDLVVLGDVTAVLGDVTAEVFRVADPAGPTNRGALTWTTIGGNAGLVVGGNAGGLPGIFFDNTTGFVKILQGTGPVIMLEVQPTGMVGPKAVADADGVRFGFDSTAKLQIVHDVSPQSRAYMVHMVTLTPIACVMVFVAGNVSLYNGGAIAQQAVFRSQIAFPIEAGQTARFPVINGLEATYTGVADDLEIAIIRITKATGVEALVGLIKSTAPSIGFVGGYTTDPLTYTYALEVRSSAALASTFQTTDSVRNVRLTISWMTLNPSP